MNEGEGGEMEGAKGFRDWVWKGLEKLVWLD